MEEDDDSCVFIPPEIISGILSWLPTKSLVRFKCVCKSWLSLITVPGFAHLQLSHSVSSNANWHVVFCGTTCPDVWALENDLYGDEPEYHLFAYDLDSPESPAVKLPLPPKYARPPIGMPGMTVVGSCNGILCLSRYKTEEVILLNPYTMSFFEVGKGPECEVRGFTCSVKECGFGYDYINDDYKIVGRLFMDWMIYSLKSNSWRRIGREIGHFMPHYGVLIGSHLLNWTNWFEIDREHVIVVFDLCNEQWGEVPIPNYLGDGRVASNRDIANLGNIDGCLCLLTRNDAGEREFCDVWVMKEYGVKESWVKLLNVSDSIVTRSLRDPPIAFESREQRQVLISECDDYEDHKLCWYNVRDKSTRCAETQVTPRRLDSFFVCWKSLVPVPGGEAFRVDETSQEYVGVDYGGSLDYLKRCQAAPE